MLRLHVSAQNLWDPVSETFIDVKDQYISLEHSLVSISKWESKWEKPFLSSGEKTDEETVDYVRCMTVTPNVDPSVYHCLSAESYKMISDYISSPMTATKFKNNKARQQNSFITAETIYYLMIAYNIPFECEKWHLNRLLALIRVCEERNKPQKKMSRSEIMAQNRALNAARRKKSGSRG